MLKDRIFSTGGGHQGAGRAAEEKQHGHDGPGGIRANPAGTFSQDGQEGVRAEKKLEKMCALMHHLTL